MGGPIQESSGGASATPGSYGEAPRGYRLPAETRLGQVRLQVADLARSLAFYEGIVGFHLIRRDPARASLGAAGDDRPLLDLIERPGARPMTARGRLGLFHVAIRLPDQASLGQFARHLAAVGVRPGAGDHLVSQALYLADPDGLGLEVYADRPRSSWRRNGRELLMATDPLDLGALLDAAGDSRWSGMPLGTSVGHVHLHVGDLAAASAFFSDALGFDRMVWGYPGALFLGAGGYHHHLGVNIWAGTGATPPGIDDARLLEWVIELPQAADVEAVAESLGRSGYEAKGEAGTLSSGVVTRDPWGTEVRFTAASPAGP